MKVLGLDYSTAPAERSPTFLAEGELIGDELRILRLTRSARPLLEGVLGSGGPWILGLDVPFSVPREFCAAVGWPEDWRGMCEAAATLRWAELKEVARSFRAGRPDRHKEAYRPCDRAARGLPPTMAVRTPLLRMFQVAGPTLARSAVDVVPFRTAGVGRTVVEVYPRLIADRLSPKSYKQDERIRREMLERVSAGALRADFGFAVAIPAEIAEIAVRNDGADALDSIFCAIEAAWAWRRGVNSCLPTDGSASEGWIIDPGLAPMEKTPHSSDRLRHYGRKCDQHLCRVRLSLDLALEGLGASPGHGSGRGEMGQAAFADSEPPEVESKLRRGLHEVHLTALKAEFELFLNRVLTVLWTSHFDDLAPEAVKGEVSLRDVARAAGSVTSVKALVTGHAVPRHGLEALMNALERGTGVPLSKSVESADWAQVRVAFAVRHLIEHTDAKVDNRFLRNVKDDWADSSWADHGKTPVAGDRIHVDEQDIDRTFVAMRRVASKVTDRLVEWSERQGN